MIGILLVFGYYEFGLFTPFNSCRAKSDIRKGDIKILIYGELLPYKEAENKLASRFGFQYKRVEDCTVNQVLINGVDHYNKVVNKHLVKHNGKDWKTKFEDELEQEINNKQ